MSSYSAQYASPYTSTPAAPAVVPISQQLLRRPAPVNVTVEQKPRSLVSDLIKIASITLIVWLLWYGLSWAHDEYKRRRPQQYEQLKEQAQEKVEEVKSKVDDIVQQHQ